MISQQDEVDISSDEDYRPMRSIASRRALTQHEEIANFLQLFNDKGIEAFKKMKFLDRLCFIGRLRDKLHELKRLPSPFHLQGWSLVMKLLENIAENRNVDIHPGLNVLKQSQYRLRWLELNAVKPFTDNEWMEELRKVRSGEERKLDTRLWEMILLMAGSRHNFPPEFQFIVEVDNYLRASEEDHPSVKRDETGSTLYSIYFTKDCRSDPAWQRNREERTIVVFEEEEISSFERLLFLMYLNDFTSMKAVTKMKALQQGIKLSFGKPPQDMNRFGFAVHQVVNLWNLVATSLDFSDVEEMLLPYLSFNIGNRSFVAKETRDCGFSPSDQHFTLLHGVSTLHGYTPVSKTSIDTFATQQTQEADAQLRRGAALFLEHIEKCLYDYHLYTCTEDWEGSNVRKFMLRENDAGFLLPGLLRRFSAVKRTQQAGPSSGYDSDDSVQFVSYRRASDFAH